MILGRGRLRPARLLVGHVCPKVGSSRPIFLKSCWAVSQLSTLRDKFRHRWSPPVLLPSSPPPGVWGPWGQHLDGLHGSGVLHRADAEASGPPGGRWSVRPPPQNKWIGPVGRRRVRCSPVSTLPNPVVPFLPRGTLYGLREQMPCAPPPPRPAARATHSTPRTSSRGSGAASPSSPSSVWAPSQFVTPRRPTYVSRF